MIMTALSQEICEEGMERIVGTVRETPMGVGLARPLARLNAGPAVSRLHHAAIRLAWRTQSAYNQRSSFLLKKPDRKASAPVGKPAAPILFAGVPVESTRRL
jgi:hypothetical protein